MKYSQNKQGGIMKNKNIKRLSQNLFAKFQTLERGGDIKKDALDLFALQYKPAYHPLQNLLNKANSATKDGASKMDLARKKRKQQDANVFLTGTGITQNTKPQPQIQQIQVPQEISHFSILKQLMSEEKSDDLSQLRKMLKETGQNIQCCRKKVYNTQKNIANYAFGLRFNDESDRQISSMNKIIQKYR